MGGKSSSAVRYPWLDPPFIGKSTSYPPCPRAGLVALRQTFVRRCHDGLGSPGLPGIDKSSMMAGKSARPWDVGTSAETECPLIHAAVIPELAGSLGRVDAGILHLGDAQLWRMRNIVWEFCVRRRPCSLTKWFKHGPMAENVESDGAVGTCSLSLAHSAQGCSSRRFLWPRHPQPRGGSGKNCCPEAQFYIDVYDG